MIYLFLGFVLGFLTGVLTLILITMGEMLKETDRSGVNDID
jgi:hypothetical protein